ncbi:MAG: transcriptional regulator [Clostridia bacterium]|nr:transcriptional regulator [Clostridia bacterium]
MKYYKELLKMECFTREDLVGLVGSYSGANSLIYDYLKKGYIERVRNNFYVVINLQTNAPVLNEYQIGSRLFDDAYMSHHTAFEYYGYYNQRYFDCYVSTNHRFEDFCYGSVNYHRVKPGTNIEINQEDGSKITSLERTMIESIKDMKKISGTEEVIKCLMMIEDKLDEEKLLKVLQQYNNGFLYQKCGYIFESLNSQFNLSANFFNECKKHISKTIKYLDDSSLCIAFNKKWNLYVPMNIYELVDKGVVGYEL